MAMTEAQGEPSMEEILASIRRIISEDEPEPAKSPSRPSTPEPEPEMLSHDAEDLMVFDDEPVAAEPMAAAPSLPPPETLVSEPVRTAAVDAFSRLSGALRISEEPGQTLEGVVRELLRPMMKQWLDANLPAIVEAKVEAELNRIARLSR